MPSEHMCVTLRVEGLYEDSANCLSICERHRTLSNFIELHRTLAKRRPILIGTPKKVVCPEKKVSSKVLIELNQRSESSDVSKNTVPDALLSKSDACVAF